MALYPKKIQTYSDRDLVEAHLLRLTPEDRYMRFGYHAHDEQIIKYVRESFDAPMSQWFGLFDDSDNAVATAHAVMIAADKAELGLSVDSEARGLGYGQSVFSRAVTWARSSGAKQIYMQCLSENKAMQHLARKNDAVVAVIDAHEREGIINYDSISVLAPFTDLAMDQLAVVDAAFKNHNKMLKRAFAFFQFKRGSASL